MVKKQNQVRKAGQKFLFANYPGGGEILTVLSFFGDSGIEYPTAAKARAANPKGTLCVKNAEYRGSTELSLSKFIRSNDKRI